MNISTKLVFVNLAFLLVVMLLGGLGAYELHTMHQITAQSQTITAALRDQIEADMMHDGLRADVLYAIKLASDGDTSEKDEAIASTQEHAENFRRLIKEVEEMHLSVEVNETLAKLKNPLEKYIANAEKMTRNSFVDIEKTGAGYEDFQKDFEYLEGAMADFSTVIESEFETVKTDVAKKEKILEFLIGGAFVFALLTAFVGWQISRRQVVAPVNTMTAIMTDLAAGNTNISIPFATQRDEIGAMAKAVQIFKDNSLEAERLRGEQKNKRTGAHRPAPPGHG